MFYIHFLRELHFVSIYKHFQTPDIIYIKNNILSYYIIRHFVIIVINNFFFNKDLGIIGNTIEYYRI